MSPVEKEAIEALRDLIEEQDFGAAVRALARAVEETWAEEGAAVEADACLTVRRETGDRRSAETVATATEVVRDEVQEWWAE